MLTASVTVFDELGLRHVDRQLADVCDVVGDALQVFGDEEQARGARRGRRVCDHQLDQVVEDALVHRVNLVVLVYDAAGGGSVAAGGGGERRAQHRGGDRGH